MTDLRHALECPVCPGLVMSRLRIGKEMAVEVDNCRRCGGLWSEQGGVQRLREHGKNYFALYTTRSAPPQPAHCRSCHALLDRDHEACPACGHDNRLNCPACDEVMPVVVHEGVRLDVCHKCKGAWFDHHELDTLWGPRFDAALMRRERAGGSTALDAGDDVVFHVFFLSPDLAGAAVMGIGEAAEGIGAVAGHVPELLAASPEAASGVIEVVGEAAADVFEAVVEIVAGVFG